MVAAIARRLRILAVPASAGWPRMPPSAATDMLEKLLIANRGEVAIRVAQAAAELGIPTVAIHA
ncbi:MAG TPA: biotin carboxylase N-terminal domain-containing protein, partial [Kofleriaceae bacterium]|nr:biotin carboxylase N-terminal domain-containing protein [Kofleriaceae bacterium]